MEIHIRERGNSGFAIARQNGNKAGLMSYSIPDSDFIIIDHTEVENDFRGQGVGDKLLDKIVEMVREKNLKILPLCPFANAKFKKRKDIQDVLKH